MLRKNAIDPLIILEMEIFQAKKNEALETIARKFLAVISIDDACRAD